MTRAEKDQLIEDLKGKLSENDIFYLADTSELTVEDNNTLRADCYNSEVSLQVVKNTLLKKAMEQVEEKDFSELYDQLTGPTSIMFSEIGNKPARVIKKFRKQHDKPVLKAAFIEEQVFLGDEQLSTLSDLKSREELIGDVISLLQSPAKNVISALQSGKDTLGGIVKTLSERSEEEGS